MIHLAVWRLRLTCLHRTHPFHSLKKQKYTRFIMSPYRKLTRVKLLSHLTLTIPAPQLPAIYSTVMPKYFILTCLLFPFISFIILLALCQYHKKFCFSEEETVMNWPRSQQTDSVKSSEKIPRLSVSKIIRSKWQMADARLQTAFVPLN